MQELSQISYRLVRFLEKKGYEAITFSPYIPVEMSIETKGLFGDVSHRHLAVKAGLGCLGYCRLLVTPNLGTKVRLATVLTSAELEQDEEYHENLCKGCEKFCASACPVNAITDDGVDVNKCVKENVKHGIPGWIGLRKKISNTNDISNYLKNYLMDPTFWRIWQATTSGIFYDCYECMKACPIGDKSKK